MSLEKSMAELAESNIKLAEAQSSLAEAQLAVAAKYDEMIAFVVANQGGTAPAAKTEPAAEAPKPRGRPKKEAAAKTEATPDDGLGGDDGDDEGLGDDVVQRTSDDVKAILKKYKEAGGAPRDIMSKFGAKAFPEIKEADFNACYEAAEKALAKL